VGTQFLSGQREKLEATSSPRALTTRSTETRASSSIHAARTLPRFELVGIR